MGGGCGCLARLYVSYKLKPFCFLQAKDFLNNYIEHELAMKWKIIFRLMEQCPAFEIPDKVDKFFCPLFCGPLSF